MAGKTGLARRQGVQTSTTVSTALERADPFTYSSRVMWTHASRSMKTKRQELEAADAEGSEGEDKQDDEGGDEREESDSEATDGDGSSEDDSSNDEDGSSSDEAGEESEEQDATDTSAAQKAVAASAQPPSLPGWQQLGPLPTIAPPMNTRRSMKLDKIKLKPRHSLVSRQLPSRPSASVTLPPPLEATAEANIDSGSEESDGISSNSEDESSMASPNRPSATVTSRISLSSPAEITSTASIPSPTVADGASRSVLVVGATPTGNSAATSQFPTLEADAAAVQSGPAPEERIAIIAGCTVLGAALLVVGLYCLFRFCVPVRTWYSDHRRKYRDEKSERLGTSPQPWKWPLQFIFGDDKPAPPRRPFTTTTESTSRHPAFARDLESNPTASTTLVADGFRPVAGEAGSYKPSSAHGATAGWVANGFYNPFTRLSERLSGWPRRSGTARWFFGSGGNKDSSRWSDSEASDVVDAAAARTTYSENTFLRMYEGQGTATTRTVSRSPQTVFDEKAGLGVQISQVELTPPLPVHSNFSTATKTTSSTPEVPSSTVPSFLASSLTSTSPLRARAITPRTSYTPTIATLAKTRNDNRASTATTATNFTTAEIGTAVAMSVSPSHASSTLSTPALPKPLFLGPGGGGSNNISHFSASTLDPATPRTFVSQAYGGSTGEQTPQQKYGVPLPPIPKDLIRPEQSRSHNRGSVASSVSSLGSVDDEYLGGTARKMSVVSAVSVKTTASRKGSMRKSGVRSVGDGVMLPAKRVVKDGGKI